MDGWSAGLSEEWPPRSCAAGGAERKDYESLQAAVALDRESGLTQPAGRLLLALLKLAIPVKAQLLQELRAEGSNIRSNQWEEPDDLHVARQELEALLTQIQPEPVRRQSEGQHRE